MYVHVALCIQYFTANYWLKILLLIEHTRECDSEKWSYIRDPYLLERKYLLKYKLITLPLESFLLMCVSARFISVRISRFYHVVLFSQSNKIRSLFANVVTGYSSTLSYEYSQAWVATVLDQPKFCIHLQKKKECLIRCELAYSVIVSVLQSYFPLALLWTVSLWHRWHHDIEHTTFRKS